MNGSPRPIPPCYDLAAYRLAASSSAFRSAMPPPPPCYPPACADVYLSPPPGNRRRHKHNHKNKNNNQDVNGNINRPTVLLPPSSSPSSSPSPSPSPSPRPFSRMKLHVQSTRDNFYLSRLVHPARSRRTTDQPPLQSNPNPNPSSIIHPDHRRVVVESSRFWQLDNHIVSQFLILVHVGRGGVI